MYLLKDGKNPNFPWRLEVHLAQEDKTFLEELAFVHGGVGLSALVREIVREKRRKLEEPIHVITGLVTHKCDQKRTGLEGWEVPSDEVSDSC